MTLVARANVLMIRDGRLVEFSKDLFEFSELDDLVKSLAC